MINGPRRSRIDWNSTEIEASKVGKTRKTPGFPVHRLFVDHVLVHRLDAGDHDEARRAAHVFAQLWPDGAPGVDVAAAFADYGAALY